MHLDAGKAPVSDCQNRLLRSAARIPAHLVLLEAPLRRVDERLHLVLGLDGLLARLVGGRVLLRVAHHLLDLVLAQAAAGLYRDALLLARRLRRDASGSISGTGTTAGVSLR